MTALKKSVGETTLDASGETPMNQIKRNLSCIFILMGTLGIGVFAVCALSILLLFSLMPAYPIALSHIQGNVPDKNDFDQFLKRDLENYFRDLEGKDITVNYELLRAGPTQTGIAYPKYYLWVRIYDGNNVIEEGAVRVAAVEKIQFDVTHYLSKERIRSDTQIIFNIFPQPVCEKIKEKIR